MDFGSEHQTAIKMVKKAKKIQRKSDSNIEGNKLENVWNLTIKGNLIASNS
jgi:hypothetical protein